MVAPNMSEQQQPEPMSVDDPVTTLGKVEHPSHAAHPYKKLHRELLVSRRETDTMQMVERCGQRTKMHGPGDLIELARHVEQADSHTKAVVGGKLELISDQIKALQAQAVSILEDAKVDMHLSHAKCNFIRKPGTIYHLYKRKDLDGFDETFFSMLSPLEWGNNPPDEYLNSYRLEHDMSWTQVDRIKIRDEKRKFNPVLLGLTSGAMQENAAQLSLTMV